MRTVIIEDEVYILEMMKHLINNNSKYQLVGTFLDSSTALEEVPALNPDVLFVDIEMPKINGLELAAKLKTEHNQIVFTTAYSQYAVEAFRVQASDYLLKPVTKKAIERITERLEKTKRQMTSSFDSGEHIHVQCLGSFKTINNTGKIVKWPTQKTEEMFAYFLTKKGHFISKWELADILWPDKDGEKAVHNVHNTMYRLKQTLRIYNLPITIQTLNQSYLLQKREDLVVDLDLYLQEKRINSIDMNRIYQLFQLYEGALFQNKDYPWALSLRKSLELTYLKYFRTLVQHYKIYDPDIATIIINKHQVRVGKDEP